jgi:signal peptidase I
MIVLMACDSRGRTTYANGESMANTIKSGQVFRITYTDQFNRNDIASFDILAHDYSQRPDENGFKKTEQRWIFRIIAVSGDQLQIKEGDVFVNDTLLRLPAKALEEYDILTSVPIDEFLDEMEKDPDAIRFERRGDTFYYNKKLTAAEVEDYRNRKPAFISVKKILLRGYFSPIVQQSASTRWSVDEFGPLRIPAVGETIVVDSSNFSLYQNIPGISMGKHVVKEPLYFVLGDNRHSASDSRYVGLISHSKMKGIVKL